MADDWYDAAEALAPNGFVHFQHGLLEISGSRRFPIVETDVGHKAQRKLYTPQYSIGTEG